MRHPLMFHLGQVIHHGLDEGRTTRDSAASASDGNRVACLNLAPQAQS
jgi:hypothetical protein